MRRMPLVAALAAVSTAVTVLAATGTARAASGGLPDHMFAPYFETYSNSIGLAAAARQSGNRFLSLAFLQTDQPGSCVAYWNGDTTQPISPASFGGDIAAIQAAGGNVIPSFGGASADTSGTELADSCTSVDAIASVFESLITTYNVPRIDLDIEGDSVSDTAGIDRRNKAVALTEAWATAHGRSIQFSYTLSVNPDGLPPEEIAILQNAIANGVTNMIVNIMTFDYYIGPPQDMVANTKTAAAALVSELQPLFPRATAQQLWHMVGVTEMIGIDDFGPGETLSARNASDVLVWARDRGISTLSFWALQRDNGGCPGTAGSDTCSGIAQRTWLFSRILEHFTR